VHNRYLSVLFLGLLLSAGCRKLPLLKCAVFPIPPEDSRSPRYVLPLDDDARKDLLERLAFGLNERNRREGVGTNADAKASYEKRLVLLMAPNKLMLQDLGGPAYQQWLPEPLVKQVVDARDRTMPKDGAVAASDGAFWWVFYPDAQGRLTGVMAAKLNACLNLKEAAR
jgi:hypothetical protein